MAFLDLTVGAPVPARQVEKRAVVTAPAERLSAAERRVVLLSRTDPASSLHAPGRIARIAAAVFGLRTPSGLADPRLEALRRFAILYRLQGETMAPAEIARAAATGLSDAALAQVRDMLGRIRGAAREAHVLRQGAIVAVLAALSFGAISLLTAMFDSRAVAVVLTGVGLVSLVSLFANRGGAEPDMSHRLR